MLNDSALPEILLIMMVLNIQDIQCSECKWCSLEIEMLIRLITFLDRVFICV